VTGTVQKVSNLFLNLNIYLRDAKDDRLLQSMSADFRGNTGESWSRALSYLIRNKLLVEPDEKNRVRQPAKLRLPRENPSPRREGGWAVLYCFCTSAADPVIGSPSHNPVMLKRVFTNAFK